MSTERLMGIENEFSFTAFNRTGGVADRQAALELMDEIAATTFVTLPCLSGSGVFMENGSRLYLDCGQHLEYCTPECTQPWDVVRYLQASERMLVQLAAEAARRKRYRSAVFYRCNVDYSGTGSTCGTHENYMHRAADTRQLPGDLIPHLVSRLIYTGAGGFDPFAAGSLGCRFSLSPRVHHIKTAISNDSTRDRGIFHTKSEALSGGNSQRLHVLVGESLCSDTGNWLKLATTALVVAMAAAGLSPGRDVTLVSPVEALHAFARDVTFRTATALTTLGSQLTALEIQRHYLTLAQMNVHAAWMPAWAPQAVEQWDAILQKLEQSGSSNGGDALATTLDWAIKRQIFTAHISKRGFTWHQLEELSEIVGLLLAARKALRPEPPAEPLSSAFILQSTGPFRDVVAEFTTDLDQLQLKWEQLDDYLKLRLELFEIDTRFGELGEGGIFNRLDAAGLLNHRFPGIDNIDHAMTNPPNMGRARFRSAAIRECHSRRAEFGCDWDCVHHFDSDRILDLSDPWTTHADWQPEPRPGNTVPERLPGLQRFFAIRDARQRLRAATSARAGENANPF